MIKSNFMTLAFALVSAIVGTSAFAASTDCTKPDQFKEIDKNELTTLINQKKVFVVDVNSAESYDKNHIPTAIHYGDYKKDADFAQALPTDPTMTIVAYCGGLQCTAWEKAATAACNANHTNVRHFKPGITGWMANNQTFFDTRTAAVTKKTSSPATSTQ